MTAIALLAQIIAQRSKVASASLCKTPDFERLLEFRYLRDAGVVSSLACTDCDQAHDAEVVFDNGQYGYFCPNLGFVPLERGAVKAVNPDIPKLVECLADAFQCKRRKSTPLQGQTWRIGAANLGHGDAILFFLPCLSDERDLRAFYDAQSREIKSTWSLIVTAEGALPVRGATSVPLSDLVELDTKAGRLAPVSDLREFLGIPAKNAGGAPNRFGTQISELINSRIAKGQSVRGYNAEAKAVLALFESEHPVGPYPSLSSVKSYLKRIRAGQ